MKEKITKILIDISVGLLWVFCVLGGLLLGGIAWMIELFGIIDMEDAIIAAFHKFSKQFESASGLSSKETLEELF